MKINVHGGHNTIIPGASGYFSEVTEDRNVKNKVIAKLQALGHTVYDCTDETGNSKSKNLSNIVAKCNAHTVDLDVSIHFNASNGAGHGVEVLIYKSGDAANPYATNICNAIAELGFRNRGVKIRTDLYVLKHTKNPALLIECCFCDNADDAALYNAEAMANAIVKGITGQVSNATANTGSSSTGAGTGTKYSIGQKVRFSTCYKSSTAPNSEAILSSNMSKDNGTITKIVAGAKNPYLLDGGLCWVNDGDIREVLNSSNSQSANKGGQIAVDGKWGKDTTLKAQKVFGTTADGIVSNQYDDYKSKNPGLLSATFEWEANPGKNGSLLIKKIQSWCGVNADGFIGPSTIKAMQRKLGTPVDGVVSYPSTMVKAFQNWLNAQ